MAEANNLPGDDVHEFARELQQAANSGGFDPFALLTGQRRFHSVFLAPVSPALRGAFDQFMADGTGPLGGVVEQFKAGGLDAAEAANRARMLFEAAQGMCVVVLVDDQGLFTIPQLFFGNLDDAYLDQVVELCGENFPDTDGLRGALIGVRTEAERGKVWPALFGGVQVPDAPRVYWEELGERLVAAIDDGLFGNSPDRLADLAHWTAAAIPASANGELDGDQYLVVARCHILAREIEQAVAAASALLQEYEPEDEALAVLVDRLSTAAVIAGKPHVAVDFFTAQAEALDAIIGGCYELALPRFRAVAASMPDAETLIAAAEGLRQADRKAFKHDLNREPLWRCAVEDPGELLDTGAAADLLDRSINFVAKRLENGTIPFYRTSDDEVRIPKAALEAWRAMMEHYQLFD